MPVFITNYKHIRACSNGYLKYSTKYLPVLQSTRRHFSFPHSSSWTSGYSTSPIFASNCERCLSFSFLLLSHCLRGDSVAQIGWLVFGSRPTGHSPGVCTDFACLTTFGSIPSSWVQASCRLCSLGRSFGAWSHSLSFCIGRYYRWSRNRDRSKHSRKIDFLSSSPDLQS